LRFYADLAVAENDEKVVIRDCSVVTNFQLENIPPRNADEYAVFVGNHFGVEWTLRVASHEPASFCFNQEDYIGDVVNVLVKIDFVQVVQSVD